MGSVAIVVTTYNHACFLAAALSSALTQSVPADEVIVVDDGSVDHPERVVARFDGVRCIRQPNAGLSAARNTGWRAATSEFVVFLDADDRLLPDALAANLRRLDATPAAAFSYGGYVDVDAATGRRHVAEFRPAAGGYPSLLRGNLVGMHGAVMYRRSCLAEIGGFDERLGTCEDYDVYLRLSLRHPVVYGPEPLAEYWHHRANMSRDSATMLRYALVVHRRQRPAAARLGVLRAYRRGLVDRKRYYVMTWCLQLVHGIRTRSLDRSMFLQGRALTRQAPVTVACTPLRAVRYLGTTYLPRRLHRPASSPP
jgi:glycosyltransferase involved in cell wall biosynthesis